MARSGGFFTVTWAGQPTFQNPPLQIWFIGQSHSLFGEGDLAARFPSLLMALATLVITNRIGRRLVGRQCALTAVALLLVTPLFVDGARGCMMEMPQVFWVSLAMLIAIEGRDPVTLIYAQRRVRSAPQSSLAACPAAWSRHLDEKRARSASVARTRRRGVVGGIPPAVANRAPTLDGARLRHHPWLTVARPSGADARLRSNQSPLSWRNRGTFDSRVQSGRLPILLPPHSSEGRARSASVARTRRRGVVGGIPPAVANPPTLDGARLRHHPWLTVARPSALTLGEAIRAHSWRNRRSIAEFSLAGFLFSYLLILLKDFQPVLIPGVIGVASISKRAHRVLHPSHVLLLAWTIVPLLVFNLSSARSARYVYPILPALALSGGWWLASVAPRFSRLLATRLVPVGVVAVALVLTVSPNLLTRDLNQTVKQSASQLKQRISEGPPVPYWGERYWEIANPLSLLRRETPGPTSADSAGRTRCRLEASGRTAGR